MKLFYKAGACSLASHIMLREVGADFELEAVDTTTGCTESGEDYAPINPGGYVPALKLADGIHLTEGAAILQFIADSHPDQAFSPKPGSIARARLQQFLNYTAAELHKSFSPLFDAKTGDREKAQAERKVRARFDYLETVFADGREYLVDGQFSVADAYLFVVANWANYKDIDLISWPNLERFVARVVGRTSVQAAMKAEGLL